jgi:enamine deaminase RidA (YjgF/YER057c/UK114 family)
MTTQLELDTPTKTHTPIARTAITNLNALDEAHDYGSAFSRGLRLDFNGVTMLMISGTASIDRYGKSAHVGDFKAQLRLTFDNITALLQAEGATWKDIVRTRCFLRDIDRDYADFNIGRNEFFHEQGLNPFPASTGIQVKLCRPELLVEIEAMAMFHEK